MGNANYRRGAAFEYERMEWHRERGAVVVFRTAGSHSPFDVVAIYNQGFPNVYFEQLKRKKKKKVSSEHADCKRDILDLQKIRLPSGCMKRYVVRLEGSKAPVILYEG